MATINSGATLDISGKTLTNPLWSPALGSMAPAQSSIPVQHSSCAMFNLAPTPLSAGPTWTISSSAVNSTDPGLTAYGYKLTKVGANQGK